MLQSMKLGVDVNRHKEIIVKAISAILLLLLKHFKLNHIYQVRFPDVSDRHESITNPLPPFSPGHNQEAVKFLPGLKCHCLFSQFEYMAQHLVFANCIPLILKFFNQNIMSYITAKNRYTGGCLLQVQPWCSFPGMQYSTAFFFFSSISVLDFPYCVVHELPELTAESLVSWVRCVRVSGTSDTWSPGCLFFLLCFLGSGRQQSILLEESFFLHQFAEDPQQTDQVETL